MTPVFPLAVRVLMGALLLVMPPMTVQAKDWLGDIETCRTLLDASIEAAELPAVGSYCADLADRIEASSWNSILSGKSVEQLDSLALEELGWFVDRFAEPAAGARLDAASLDAIIAGLPQLQEPELSVWQRIWRWVTDQFGGDEAADDSLFDWLEGMKVSEEVVTVLLTVIGVVIVAAGVAIAFNEIRIARRGIRRAAAATLPSHGATTATAGAVSNLDSLSLEEQPAAVLSTIARRLGELRDTLTHRELTRGLEGLSVGQHAVLDTLSTTAERVRYAPALPDDEALRRAVADGRQLAEQLSSR